MKILGTKFFGHDSALCLIDTEKKEIFAMSTERVTRIKHDWFDISPILKEYNIKDFDVCCHGFANFKNEDTCIETKANTINKLKQEKHYRNILKPQYIKDFKKNKQEKMSLFLKALFLSPMDVIKYLYYRIKSNNNISFTALKNETIVFDYIKSIVKITNIKFYDHHLCHAAASYYISPFSKQESLCLTLDGQGDGYFSKAYIFNNNTYKEIGASKVEKFNINDNIEVTSIGEIYGNFTEAMDLRRNSDEGKVEALAAFGKVDEELYSLLKEAIVINNLSISMKIDKVKKFYDYRFLKEKRKSIGDENFCSTIQRFLEDIVVEYVLKIKNKYPSINSICLSGGVAANIIMSLSIYEKTGLKNIFILPAMGDDGVALGSAILCAIDNQENIEWLKDYYMPYYGDQITKNNIKKAIEKFNSQIKFSYIGDSWYKDAAYDISENKVIALVNGRMEYGPRALGNRTIAANAINQDTRQRINSTVKRRPMYQPFCPSILEEERERLFEDSFQHKHMAIAFRVKEKYWKSIPSGIHVDGTARPQFVEEQDNPSYYKFIKEVKKLTGIGIVIDTSFNLHGRTIVRTAEDAITDFIDCNIDTLYIEGYKIERI